MKKKLLVAILAAGLVLPSTAALAEGNKTSFLDVLKAAKEQDKGEKIAKLELKEKDLLHELEVETGKLFTKKREVTVSERAVKEEEDKVKKAETVLKFAKATNEKVAEKEAALEQAKAAVEAAKLKVTAAKSSLKQQDDEVKKVETALKAVRKELQELKGTTPQVAPETPANPEAPVAQTEEGKKDDMPKENGKKMLPKTSAVK